MKKWKLAQKKVAWQTSGDRNIGGHTARIPEQFMFIGGDGPRGVGIDLSTKGKILALAECIIPQTTVSKRNELCSKLEDRWLYHHGAGRSRESSHTANRGKVSKLDPVRSLFDNTLMRPGSLQNLLSQLRNAALEDMSEKPANESRSSNNSSNFSKDASQISLTFGEKKCSQKVPLQFRRKERKHTTASKTKPRTTFKTKLTTASKTNLTASRTKLTASKTNLTASKTNLTASKTNLTASKTNLTASKTKLTASKTKLRTASKTNLTASKTKSAPSSRKKSNNDNIGKKKVAAKQRGGEGGGGGGSGCSLTVRNTSRLRDTETRSLSNLLDKAPPKQANMTRALSDLLDSPELSDLLSSRRANSTKDMRGQGKAQQLLSLLQEAKGGNPLQGLYKYNPTFKKAFQATGVLSGFIGDRFIMPLTNNYATNKNGDQSFTRRRTKGLMYDTLEPVVLSTTYLKKHP